MSRVNAWAQASLLLFGSCLLVLVTVLVAPLLPVMQAHFSGTSGIAALVPLVIALPALMAALLAPFVRKGQRPRCRSLNIHMEAGARWPHAFRWSSI